MSLLGTIKRRLNNALLMGQICLLLTLLPYVIIIRVLLTIAI